MGRAKYQKDIERLFSKSPIVDVQSISRLIRSRKRIKQYQKQLVRNLVLKGKIKRLSKGIYTTHDEPSLTVFCFKPSYLGLQDALGFHNLWEQETIPVIVTAKKARPGIRKFLGMNISIRRINKKYLFGFEYYKDGSFYLPYSDVEKTLIDMVYFGENISADVLENASKRIDKKKLCSYLKLYPERLRKRVLAVLDVHKSCKK